MADATHSNAAERIAKFVEIYQGLRRESPERILPRRYLNLKAVHPFANALTIVDISKPDFWRIRLSGTQACERLGQDTTGGNARDAFDDAERALRHALAHSLFDHPSGIRAKTRETYATGDQALLDTIALPMTGENGERLVVHYAQIIQDIEHGYGLRPRAARTGLESYEYVDLGHGIPHDELRLTA